MKILLGIILFSLGLLVGKEVPIKQQMEIYSLVGNSAGMVIGIAGAWYAVLLPEIIVSLRRKEKETYVHAIELHNRLLKPLIMGISLFSISLLVRALKPAVGSVFIWLHGLISTQFSIMSIDSLYVLFQQISFGVCLVLVGWLVWILLCLLRPYDYIKTFIDKSKKKSNVMDKLGESAEEIDI